MDQDNLTFEVLFLETLSGNLDDFIELKKILISWINMCVTILCMTERLFGKRIY